jgi:hypothetical protein
MVSYDYTEDRFTSLEKDRKQMQTKLENLHYAMMMVESQMNKYNNYDTQIKEVYENLYCIVMGTVLGIVIFVLFVKHY